MAFSFPSTATSTPSSTAPFLHHHSNHESEEESTSFLPRPPPTSSSASSSSHSPSSSQSNATHSRTTSTTISTPPGGWFNALSRRFAQRNFTRRALAVVMLGLVALVTLLSTTVNNDQDNEETGWYRGMKDSFEQRWNTFGRISSQDQVPEKMNELNLSKVLNFETPQDTLFSQLKDGVRYATAMSYGGHANQMISIQKLLYFAKITNRVPIIPSLIPVHIEGGPENISTFYDLPLFYHLTSLPALEMSQIKTSSFWDNNNNSPQKGEKQAPIQEDFPCWSIQESTVGFPNREAISFDMHNLYVHHWPLPGNGMARGAGGFDLSFDALRIWDSDVWAKDRWIDKVRKEYLPQQVRKDSTTDDVKILPEIDVTVDEKARKENMKEGFGTHSAPSPTDQIVAFDNSLFLGPIMFPPIDLSPSSSPLEPGLAGEGTSWQEIGQHLHFTELVESRATSYLMKLFPLTNPDRPQDLPPFITIHLRRGDFAEFTGAYTDLEKYVQALNKLLPRLQQRIDDPTSFSGPGRTPYRKPHYVSNNSNKKKLAASSYSIVATTDESSSSPFVQKVKQLGWKVVDHEEFNTKQEFGGWWPTLLDCAILARGASFVGTDRSTYTHLAALRVKYWNGGVSEIA